MLIKQASKPVSNVSGALLLTRSLAYIQRVNIAYFNPAANRTFARQAGGSEDERLPGLRPRRN